MHLPRVSGKTNPEEVCCFINVEFSVRMNPFSVEAWTCLGKIMLHTRHKDHNTQLYWWTGCMLPEIYVP